MLKGICNKKLSFSLTFVSVSLTSFLSFAVVKSGHTEVTAARQSIQQTIVQTKQGSKVHISLDPKPFSEGPLGGDILLIVDNSGSMQSHQQKLSQSAGNIANLLSELPNNHVGVLTTDAESGTPGVFAKPWLDSSQVDFSQRLAQQILVGTEGSGVEKHFESLFRFLDQQEVGYNKGFRRKESGLHVVVVTDAEDQSHGISEWDVLDRISNNLNGFHGLIVPSNDTLGCSRDDTNTFPSRIERVINLMNGITVDLCEETSKYQSGLTSIMNDIKAKSPIVKKAVVIPLNFKPVEKSISVSFGSETVNDWSYREATNSIEFAKDHDWNTQPDGTELKIEFSI